MTTLPLSCADCLDISESLKLLEPVPALAFTLTNCNKATLFKGILLRVTTDFVPAEDNFQLLSHETPTYVSHLVGTHDPVLL